MLVAVLVDVHLVLLPNVEADGEVVVVDTLRADLAVVHVVRGPLLSNNININ